jgi:hypothetical protein
MGKADQHMKSATSSARDGRAPLWLLVVLLGLAGSTVFGGRAGAATARVYAVPGSIASDCSRDISTKLTRFIATVPNGTAADPNTINFKANGCYQVGLATQVINRVGLVLAGNNATIQRKNPIALNSGRTNKALLMIASSRNMTIRDFKFIGDNTNVDSKDPGNYYDFDLKREAEHALFIYNDQSDFPTGVSDNTLISNIKTDSVYGDAVRLWGARNVRVEKSLIYGAGRQGVAARGTDRLVIVDNRFDYLRRTAIDFEEDPVTNVRIQRNHFESHKFNLGNFPGSAGADRNILMSNNTAGPDAPLGIRCTTPTTAVKIENNQPAFKNTASAGSGSSDIPCSPQGFDESQLPPLES